MPNVEDISAEVDLLRVKICSLTESHMSATPIVVTPIFKLAPLPGPRHFNLFMENYKLDPINVNKRGQEGTYEIPLFHLTRALNGPNVIYKRL